MPLLERSKETVKDGRALTKTKREEGLWFSGSHVPTLYDWRFLKGHEEWLSGAFFFLRERVRERVGEALGWFSNVLSGSGLWHR